MHNYFNEKRAKLMPRGSNYTCANATGAADFGEAEASIYQTIAQMAAITFIYDCNK